MKGIYDKKAIGCLVDPLRAISSVFNNNAVHVVYENTEDTMLISTRNANRSIFAIFELNAKEAIKSYEVGFEDAPIWNVKQFIDILNKYQSEIYVEDVEIDCQDNKLIISCGKDTTDFFLGQKHLFEESRGKVKRLKTDTLDTACGFKLDGVNLKKVLANINVFTEQDILTISGKKGGDEVMVKLSSSAGTVFNKNESMIEDVKIDVDFNMDFKREDIKGLLECNDSFNFGVYTGEKEIISAIYNKDHYEMRFYFSKITRD